MGSGKIIIYNDSSGSIDDCKALKLVLKAMYSMSEGKLREQLAVDGGKYAVTVIRNKKSITFRVAESAIK